MIDIADIPRADFTHDVTIRLISTAYIDEPALSPLADSERDLKILEDIEALTSGRRNNAIPLPIGVHPDELLTERHGYGWTYVNAAFCYTRSTGNRFNTQDRGAWYATFGHQAAETAQAEVAWHLTRELEATGVFENTTAYRELIAGFTTVFHDLSPYKATDLFDPDPAIGYPAGQSLASQLLAAGSNGVIYPSVRHPAGNCLAAFRPHTVQNIRQGATWAFRWSGKPAPVITKLGSLAGEDEILR